VLQHISLGAITNQPCGLFMQWLLLPIVMLLTMYYMHCTILLH